MADARSMGDDRLRRAVRDVLAHVGAGALPARPFTALVEVPVRSATERHERPSRRVGLAFAAVLVLVVGAVGLWAAGGRETTTVAIAPMSDRTAAVPLYVPEDMALVSAGVETRPAPDGSPIETPVARWERRNAWMSISSSPLELVPEPTGDRAFGLSTGATAFMVERDSALIMSWRQPDGGPTVSIRSSGLTVDDVVAIADSMWYVTPALWDELTDHAGFATADESNEGYDHWSPATDIDLGGDPAVRVLGSLHDGFMVFLFPGNHGFSFDPERPCSVGSLMTDPDADRWPVVLFGPRDVTAFVFDETDGAEQRVPAVEHPGLPQLRFAVALTSALDQGMRSVGCERGES